MEKQIIRNEELESLKIIRYAKGYGWEIKVYGDKAEDLVKRIKEINKAVREELEETE